MPEAAKDQGVLNHIQELVTEEHRLYGQAAWAVLTDAEQARLKPLKWNWTNAGIC